MEIKLKVKTAKSQSKVIKTKASEYEVWVKSRPVKGAANREVLEVLADYFNVKKYNIRITQGLLAPNKVIKITK